jgi:transposase
VVEELDLTAVLDSYVEDKGFPPFHPAMMTGLLLYAYTQGVFSSRKIAKACIERMDFAAVTGFQKPDFRTISLFRKRHLTALGGLFQQVLVLCRQAGLVALGHVALDGTKVKANASKHRAMGYDRMVKADNEFAEVVKGWLDQAEITDLGEDYRFRNRQGDELPAWVANKAERMKKIRKAGSCPPRTASSSATTPRPEWTLDISLSRVSPQIKQAMGFRQFLMRGLAKVRAEWQLVCLAHNLRKLARAAI